MAIPVVAFDLDEVLGRFIHALAQYSNRVIGGKQLTEEDFFSYRFSEVWECDEEESSRRVRGFFESPEFTDLEPLEGAIEVLQRRKAEGRLRFVVVTSRQAVIEAETRAWVERFFPCVFDAILLGNHWGSTGAKRSKTEMCLEAGAVALVDDSPQYVMETAAALPLAVLFGVYAWAPIRTEDALPHNVVRSPNWKHLDELLGRIADSHAEALSVTSSSGAAAMPTPPSRSFETLYRRSELQLRLPSPPHVQEEAVKAAVKDVTRRLELQQHLQITVMSETGSTGDQCSAFLAAVVRELEERGTAIAVGEADGRQASVTRTATFLRERFGFDDRKCIVSATLPHETAVRDAAR
jgi:hypothetical protein